MPASLADRIARAPRPHDPALAADDRRPLRRPEPGPARELLAGAAGCSAFLAGLIAREADWLRAALDAPPEATHGGDPRGDAGRRPAALADSLRIARAAPRCSSPSPTSAAPGISTTSPAPSPTSPTARCSSA